MKFWIDCFVWRLLWSSGVFRAWVEEFLCELCSDLEDLDLEDRTIVEKYRAKLDSVEQGKQVYLLEDISLWP